MNLDIAHKWLQVARSSCRAAELLFHSSEDVHRSVVGRSYYASSAAAHAILISCGQETPSYGNWSNEQLPIMLLAVLRARNVHDLRWRTLGKLHAQGLQECWLLRLKADYAPSDSLDRMSAKTALKIAHRLTATATEVLQ